MEKTETLPLVAHDDETTKKQKKNKATKSNKRFSDECVCVGVCYVRVCRLFKSTPHLLTYWRGFCIYCCYCGSLLSSQPLSTELLLLLSSTRINALAHERAFGAPAPNHEYLWIAWARETQAHACVCACELPNHTHIFRHAKVIKMCTPVLGSYLRVSVCLWLLDVLGVWELLWNGDPLNESDASILRVSLTFSPPPAHTLPILPFLCFSLPLKLPLWAPLPVCLDLSPSLLITRFNKIVCQSNNMLIGSNVRSKHGVVPSALCVAVLLDYSLYACGSTYCMYYQTRDHKFVNRIICNMGVSKCVNMYNIIVCFISANGQQIWAGAMPAFDRSSRCAQVFAHISALIYNSFLERRVYTNTIYVCWRAMRDVFFGGSHKQRTHAGPCCHTMIWIIYWWERLFWV